MQSIRLFVSHASEDSDLAERVVDLVRSGLGLPAAAIRCTSVDGFRLPGGADTDEQLRREVHDCEAFIGIVSASGVRSAYVLFELGARWGAGKPLIPLLAPGIPASLLRGPLAGLNALRADNRAQLHQLLGELAGTLTVPLESAAAYEKQIGSVLATPVADPRSGETQRPMMTFKAPFWYRDADNVPHCPRCWEVDGTAIHLQGPIRVVAGKRFDCAQCRNFFITDRK